eukprot:COSAG02_NODE_10041_length_2039_cov_5.113918_1_plen_24_part_10
MHARYHDFVYLAAAEAERAWGGGG